MLLPSINLRFSLHQIWENTNLKILFINSEKTRHIKHQSEPWMGILSRQTSIMLKLSPPTVTCTLLMPLRHLPYISPKSSGSISLLFAVGQSAHPPPPMLFPVHCVKQQHAARAECPKPLKPSCRKHTQGLQKEVGRLPEIKWRTTNKWSNWAH